MTDWEICKAIDINQQFALFVCFADGAALYRAFLIREFSNENLEFWLACEEYKNSKPQKMAAKAQKIYNDFIAVQAPKEVSLVLTYSTCVPNSPAISISFKDRLINSWICFRRSIWMPRRDLSQWPTSSQIIRTRKLSIAPRNGSSTWWSATLTFVSSNQNSSLSLSIRNAIWRRRTNHRRLRESQNCRREGTDGKFVSPKQTNGAEWEISGLSPLFMPRPPCSNFGIVVSSRYGRAALWYYYSRRLFGFLPCGTGSKRQQWWETWRYTQSFSLYIPLFSYISLLFDLHRK